MTTVEILQRLGAGYISRQTAWEYDDELLEPEAETRRIVAERLDDLLYETLTNQARKGRVSLGQLVTVVEEFYDGADLYEAIGSLYGERNET